jgi:hypothetical protein
MDTSWSAGLKNTMSDWKAKSFSANSTPVEVTDDILNEKVVILMQGKNVFGDAIYSYVQLTLRNLQDLKDSLTGKQNISPSDYGTVVAAGTGEPDQELRSEMAIRYNMVDVPSSIQAQPSNMAEPTGMWDDD